jgi:hypothetical protein
MADNSGVTLFPDPGAVLIFGEMSPVAGLPNIRVSGV